jgi:thiamine pyrophosphate-dependent acetolactate synthase large subunit-like protein
MSTNAADILVETIQDWGVDVVFGLPGDGINGIMEALRKKASTSDSSRHGMRRRPRHPSSERPL